MIICENMADSLSMNIPCCLCYVIHYGGEGGGVLNKVLYGEALPLGPNPSPFNTSFLTRKVTVSDIHIYQHRRGKEN